MKPEVQHIVLALEDGSLAIMQFITRQQPHGNDPGWTREATDENIKAEIAKGGLPIKYWRLLDAEALPAERENRDAWRDVGSHIRAVDDNTAWVSDAP